MSVGGFRKVSTILCCSFPKDTIGQLQGEKAAYRNQRTEVLTEPAGDKIMNEQKTVKELPACPVETTLSLIGDKWKVLILRDLLPGTKRFGELKKSVGNVSQKVLTAQLRTMEANGLLTRTVYAEVPPRVEYTLTELGKSLKPVLDAMWNWGEEYKASL
jgi:DNA-binding HxlR family transcriptional regulator